MKSKQINVIILIFIQFGTIKTIKISDIERFQIDVPENVTTNCRQQMEEFVENLQFNSESWALKMLDATSKIPTGIFSLNFGELGSFDECINITSKSSEIYGKYCLGTIDLSNFNLSVPTLAPTWAVCLPNQCTSKDIGIIVDNLLLKNLIGFDSFQITFNDLLCQTRDDVYPKLTTGAILTISLLIFLLLLVLISTIYDVYCRQIGRPPAHEILIAFSLYTNGRKVFRAREPNPDELPCLDGLKFFSMMWVVSGHTFSIPASNGAIVNINGVLEWINSWRSMFIVSGTLSVDTFLVIAGCLMLYGFMKAQAKQIKFNVFLYYLHRYLRLTPCLAVVVLFSATMMNYFGSGPRWPLLNLWFKGNCEKYWWSTLLYVQNYVNVDQMVEIIQKYMGTVEIYNAITDDGYILPIYRIPRWKSKGTILLQHPLLSDSYVYVGQGNGSLAYLLWQNGYEIWLSNARGTRASRHQTLTQQDYQFWNFSFDEIGRYDTPKIINVIKSLINDTKIIYVGYSEASVIAYIYASLYPEEALRSIRVFIIGGSCAIFKNYSSPLKFIAPAWPILQPILNSLKIGNLVPPLLVELLSFLVRTFPILATAASVFVDIICGWTRNADPSIFNTGGTAYLSDVPAKTLIHFAQLGMNNGHFRMFDYGVRRNQQYYHQRIPPEYPLEKISVPVYLIISRNDTLTTVEDTFEVYKKLPAEAQIYTVSVIVGLNHLDFFTGRNRKQKFYDLVVSFIKNNFN